MPTELEVRTDSSAYNKNTLGKQLIHEEYNSAYNHHVIVEAYHEGRAKDINLEEKKNGEPCFILASGPSLDEILPKLKDWKGGIICTTSHALSLMRYGIEPTHILALDPFNCWHEIEGVDWSKTRTKLITTPGVWPTLIANWPNEMLLYIQNLGSRDNYYSHGQKRMYTTRRPQHEKDLDNPDGICRDAIFDFIIRTEITQFACSPPCQMFAAQILGYGRIFLIGHDFGGKSDWDRFADFTVEQPAKTVKVGNGPDIEVPIKWKRNEHPIDPTEQWITSANGMRTNSIMLFYKKNILTAWRLSSQDVFICNDGIITEVPYMDIDKVVSKSVESHVADFKKTHYWDKKHEKYLPFLKHEQFVSDKAETYLAKVGAFVVNVGKAFSFVEAAHPIDNWFDKEGVEREGELVSFMKAVSRKWECDQCHAIGQADDDKNWKGETCKACGQGKMFHAGKIDIEGNIKKFRKLIGKLPVSQKANVLHVNPANKAIALLPAFRILGFSEQPKTVDEIKERYRGMAKLNHPDNLEEGDKEAFQILKKAYDDALVAMEQINNV